MMHYIRIVQTVLALLPLLAQAIKMAEEAIPGRGKGEQKLAMIREIMESVHRTAGEIGVGFDQLWPTLERAIARLVSAYNSDGTLPR